jgi:hypothetical protein
MAKLKKKNSVQPDHHVFQARLPHFLVSRREGEGASRIRLYGTIRGKVSVTVHVVIDEKKWWNFRWERPLREWQVKPVPDEETET